jgi:hypothetical protein
MKNISIPEIIILLSIFMLTFLLSNFLFASGNVRETIVYAVSPLGYSQYQDFGLVDLGGRKVNLVVFKSRVAGFEDTERIYSEPDTYLPLWVERDLSMWFHKEYLTEEYVPGENKLTIRKFEAGKKTAEYFFKGKGPIHNAILLPFCLRKIPDLKVGWSYQIRLPDEFRVELVSIEKVAVPAGKFMSYHFISTPPKFEIWITKDALRLPVKIKGLGAFSYTLNMKEHIVKAPKAKGKT